MTAPKHSFQIQYLNAIDPFTAAELSITKTMQRFNYDRRNDFRGRIVVQPDKTTARSEKTNVTHPFPYDGDSLLPQGAERQSAAAKKYLLYERLQVLLYPSSSTNNPPFRPLTFHASGNS